MYCPYCNRRDCSKLTDEHVIPRSIGGDPRTLIRICSDCNSNVGSKADAMLARHSGLRFLSLGSGFSKSARPQEHHPSIATLYDGTKLTGHVSVDWPSKKQFRLEFHPQGIQTDGLRWMTERQLNGATGPPGVRILSPEEIKMTSFEIRSGEGFGMESAVLKIMLGIRYLAEGDRIISNKSFDRIRSSLLGTIDPTIAVNWIDPKECADELPIACGNDQHLIWESCTDGDVFCGGVCFFGRICMTVEISAFGLRFAPAHTCIDLPWLNTPKAN